jgi:pyruvate formate lyase activating enzyme
MKEAMLYEKLDNGEVHCSLCAHGCVISEGSFGFCGVRQNRDGVLYTLVYGEVIASNVDPIEKKPLYHFLPGTLTYSIATMGCNFRCGFCQNWQISQMSKRKDSGTSQNTLSPEEIVRETKRNNCCSISYTYTEPTIFFEYAYDISRIAKAAGLANVFVTNGYMTRKAIDTIRPYLDAVNIDLKSYREDYYKTFCKAHLQPVLDSILFMKKLNIWIEITSLIIPGENDSDEELEQIAGFIARMDKEVPWHISRFFPQYKLTEHLVTPMSTLERAKAIGEKHGLSRIYLGNV